MFYEGTKIKFCNYQQTPSLHRALDAGLPAPIEWWNIFLSSYTWRPWSHQLRTLRQRSDTWRNYCCLEEPWSGRNPIRQSGYDSDGQLEGDESRINSTVKFLFCAVYIYFFHITKTQKGSTLIVDLSGSICKKIVHGSLNFGRFLRGEIIKMSSEVWLTLNSF